MQIHLSYLTVGTIDQQIDGKFENLQTYASLRPGHFFLGEVGAVDFVVSIVPSTFCKIKTRVRTYSVVSSLTNTVCVRRAKDRKTHCGDTTACILGDLQPVYHTSLKKMVGINICGAVLLGREWLGPSFWHGIPESKMHCCRKLNRCIASGSKGEAW